MRELYLFKILAWKQLISYEFLLPIVCFQLFYLVFVVIIADLFMISTVHAPVAPQCCNWYAPMVRDLCLYQCIVPPSFGSFFCLGKKCWKPWLRITKIGGYFRFGLHVRTDLWAILIIVKSPRQFTGSANQLWCKEFIGSGLHLSEHSWSDDATI